MVMVTATVKVTVTAMVVLVTVTVMVLHARASGLGWEVWLFQGEDDGHAVQNWVRSLGSIVEIRV